MDKSIVFFLGSLKRGGAERVVSIIASYYYNKNYKVYVALLLDNINDYNMPEGIEIIPLTIATNNMLYATFTWYFKIGNLIRRLKPTVIISFFARINILVILSCLRYRRRIIVSERNDPNLDGRSGLIKIMTYFFYPICNRIVFQTAYARNLFPISIQRKSKIIPNPINLEFKTRKNIVNKIVSVGRLSVQKNQQELIRAFKIFSMLYPNYSLYIYGEGELRQKLEELVKDLGLSNKVFLPGNIKNIHEEIADAEMFILCSLYEGLSNALLESMLLGIPCIVSNIPSSIEFIEDGSNGMVYSNFESLVTAMSFLAKNSEIGISMGEKAKKTVERLSIEVYRSWDQIVDEIGK